MKNHSTKGTELFHTRASVSRIASGVFASALILCAVTLSVYAQQSAKPAASTDNPLSTFTTGAHGAIDVILLSAAQKIPEENYGFKPTDTVRSFGQIFGHLADAQYMFCWRERP